MRAKAGVRRVVARRNHDLAGLGRFLKNEAEALYTYGIGVHEPVVDDDEVRLRAADEDRDPEPEQDYDLFLGPVAEARER